MIDLYDESLDLNDRKTIKAREDRTVLGNPDDFFADLLMEQQEQQ